MMALHRFAAMSWILVTCTLQTPTSAERNNLDDALASCKGYTDQVSLPPLGSHVWIVGRYVQDTFHGQWNEIHPVTSITVIS
jgi:hypothetical protein